MAIATSSLKFDARPDRIDLRDRPYNPPLDLVAEKWPRPDQLEQRLPEYIAADMILDQGSEGACTGFGLAATINYLLFLRDINAQPQKTRTRVSPRMLYHLARFYDEWPREDYEGSSCRGAIKGWHKHGVCSDELWRYRDKKGNVVFIRPQESWAEDAATRPLGVYYRINRASITDMQAAIQDVGAIYVSARVHEGWSVKKCSGPLRHDSLPQIDWGSRLKMTGGHAFALVGYNERGFIVQNSWGTGWGNKGFAVLSYPDWHENGSDAWACVLGAPMLGMPSPVHITPSGDLVGGETTSAEKNIADLLSSSDKPALHNYTNDQIRPWDVNKAYDHTLVLGNNGRVLQRNVIYANSADMVKELACELPGQWFSGLNKNIKKKIIIYAHGGLNSEQDSLKRICMLAPYFKANNIYPLFLSWRTGFKESLVARLGDKLNDLIFRGGPSEGFDISYEPFDRTVEAAAEHLGIKAIWSEMKQNAEASCLRDKKDPRGGILLIQALAKLLKKHPVTEIHMVGHSAGSIILGHFLDVMRKAKLPVKSCTLYAAACSLSFANRHYQRAVKDGILFKKNLHFHMLSPKLELQDTVGPVYHKSLLYLVSRALEDHHKTPLLGMAAAFDKHSLSTNIWNRDSLVQVKKWQSFWKGKKNTSIITTNKIVCAVEKTNHGTFTPSAMINASHGSFDNDVKVISQTIERILGGKLRYPVENLQY
jgi:hypothetical protein